MLIIVLAVMFMTITMKTYDPPRDDSSDADGDAVIMLWFIFLASMMRKLLLLFRCLRVMLMEMMVMVMGRWDYGDAGDTGEDETKVSMASALMQGCFARLHKGSCVSGGQEEEVVSKRRSAWLQLCGGLSCRRPSIAVRSAGKIGLRCSPLLRLLACSAVSLGGCVA